MQPLFYFLMSLPECVNHVIYSKSFITVPGRKRNTFVKPCRLYLAELF